MENKRKWDLDVIRILACYLVIMIHVLANGRKIGVSVSADWIFYNVFTGIVRCAVPFYFMLSGILFLDKKISVRKLYQKYVTRIVLALIVWSVFYAFADFFRDGGGSLRYLIIRILSRHYHLWFLLSILGVYICLPVVQELVNGCSCSLLKYMGGVILVVVTGKATLDPFLHHFFNTAVWDSLWNDMGISGISAGLIYFVAGYYLYKYKDRMSKRTCLFMAVLMVCMMSGIDMFFSLLAGEHMALTGSLEGMWVLILSCSLFVILSQSLSGYDPGEKMRSFLETLSECTFGIYLVHVFFLECLYPVLEMKAVPYVFFVFFFSGVLFLVSFCTTWCIRRIPVAGLWIM